jgi:hypothetical protein
LYLANDPLAATLKPNSAMSSWLATIPEVSTLPSLAAGTEPLLRLAASDGSGFTIPLVTLVKGIYDHPSDTA